MFSLRESFSRKNVISNPQRKPKKQKGQVAYLTKVLVLKYLDGKEKNQFYI